MSIKRTLLGLSVLTIALAGLMVGRSAMATTGLTVSPPTYELSANPGDTLSNTVRITNNSPGAVSLQVSAQDFTVHDTEGSVTVQDSGGTDAIAKWIRIEAGQIQLATGASALVPFKISVPRDAEPGGHFATILFNPTASSSSSATGANVIQRVGSLILMRVSGKIVENGSISKFHTKSFIGSYTTITGADGKTKFFIPQGEQLGKEHAKSYFSHGPVAFDLAFKNGGNVYFKPGGTVTIYNAFGHKVDQLAIDPRNVFPGGERRVTVLWPKDRLWGGYYRAQVASVYGSQNKVLTAETVFWVFPLMAVIITLVVLVLLILLRHRLLTAARVLIKGR